MNGIILGTLAGGLSGTAVSSYPLCAERALIRILQIYYSFSHSIQDSTRVCRAKFVGLSMCPAGALNLLFSPQDYISCAPNSQRQMCLP